MASQKKTVTLTIPNYSDGDATHVPSGQQYFRDSDAVLHRQKLASAWLEDSGQPSRDHNYIIDKLPAGYSVWQKRRQNNPAHIDKLLYGHPKKRTFDSVKRFLPHFLALMKGSTTGCQCVNCSDMPKRKHQPGRPLMLFNESSSVARPRPKPVAGISAPDRRFVDDEGSPNVVRNLIHELKKRGTLEQPIEEPLSLDWLCEKQLLDQYLKRLTMKPAWQPRVGEIVLYARNVRIEDEIRLDKGGNGRRYRIWSSQARTFIGIPAWAAGVVAQAPQRSLRIADLTKQQDTTTSINLSGFNIEAYPDPNTDNKMESVQAMYVPLAHIRPFVYHEYFLQGIEVEEWHPTIQHAIRSSSTVSLVGKYGFSGQWPECDVYCRALFIGHELLKIGDAVRLDQYPPAVSPAPPAVNDILLISNIKLRFWNLDQASNDPEGHPYNCSIHLDGELISILPSASGARITTYEDMDKYGPLYSKYGLNTTVRVPFNRVLTRLIEHKAMAALFPDLSDAPGLTLLTMGFTSLHTSRRYSAATSRHVDQLAGKSWFFADSRTEALDLHRFNGQDVALWDESRDPRTWRRMIKILDGTATEADREQVVRPGDIDGLLMSRSTMIRSAAGVSDEEHDAEGAENAESAENAEDADVMDVDDEDEFSTSRAGVGW